MYANGFSSSLKPINSNATSAIFPHTPAHFGSFKHKRCLVVMDGDRVKQPVLGNVFN
jgi:putative SOS response-associated peptidase YedK